MKTRSSASEWRPRRLLSRLDRAEGLAQGLGAVQQDQRRRKAGKARTRPLSLEARQAFRVVLQTQLAPPNRPNGVASSSQRTSKCPKPHWWTRDREVLAQGCLARVLYICADAAHVLSITSQVSVACLPPYLTRLIRPAQPLEARRSNRERLRRSSYNSQASLLKRGRDVASPFQSSDIHGVD
jgi:hypothetical protein